jgi:hypothetical protein
MSNRTRFLARLIGLYCLLAAVMMLLQREGMIAAVTAIVQHGALLLILGLITVAAGLALVLAHNVWSGGALPVIVTLIGWATLLKGLMFWVLPPAAAAAFYLQHLRYAQLFYLYAALSLVIGVYLTVAGFRNTPRAA